MWTLKEEEDKDDGRRKEDNTCFNRCSNDVSVPLQYPWSRTDPSPRTLDKLLGLIMDDDNSADGDRKPKEKEDNTPRMNLCFLSEKEEDVLITNELIGVATKS